MMILILVIAFIVRFAFLGSIPPSVSEVFPLRIISAVCGFFSVILSYYLVKRISKNKELALFSALSLAILPISIIENRIVSWVSVAVFLIIVSYFFIIDKSPIKKVFGFLLFIIFLFYINKEILLINRLQTKFDFNLLLNNFFDALSFNKIFFTNDSYWSGGIRRYGMIYPEIIPIFLVGVFELLNKKRFDLILFGLSVLLIAALSPTYPEAREIGLLAPIIAIILGFGGLKVFNYFKRNTENILVVISGLAYLIVLLYGIINFFHYYFIHYDFGVKQENYYQINKF